MGRFRARMMTTLAASMASLGLLSCNDFERQASRVDLTPTCATLSGSDGAIRSPEDHGVFRFGTARSGFAHYAGVSQAEVVRFYPKQVPSSGRQTSYTIDETRLWVRDERYVCGSLLGSGPAETFPNRQVLGLLPSLEENLSPRELDALKDAAFGGKDVRYASSANLSTNVPSIDRVNDILDIEVSNRTGSATILSSYPSSWVGNFLL